MDKLKFPQAISAIIILTAGRIGPPERNTKIGPLCCPFCRETLSLIFTPRRVNIWF